MCHVKMRWRILFNTKLIIMELIKSLYTHTFTYNNHFFVYNSEVNGFFEVEKDVYESLEFSKIKNLSANYKELLLNNKILVEEKAKYAYYMRNKLLSCLERFCSTKLTMTLIPTTSCNFKCPYCFEEHKTNKTMTDAVIDKLIDFINAHDTSKLLNVMWYGGEPLLAFGRMKQILHKIETECNLKIHSQSIITNGYLFDEEKCLYFKEHPLSDIQITIDGTKEFHNKIRYSATDNNTYDKILDNIDRIVQELPDTRVFIRINIDEANKGMFPTLHKEFLERWKGKKVYVYPGFVRIDNENHTNMASSTIVEDSKRRFYFELEKYGLPVAYFPEHRTKSCSAVRKNSYIIGPEGEIYKCWNDVSNLDKAIGYLGDNKLNNEELLGQYLTEGTMFEDQKCKECFFFPICDGGCPQYRLRNKYDGGQYDLCAVRNDKRANKEFLTECLIRHYEHVKGITSIEKI